MPRWQENPPGPEQIELEDKFNQGLIEDWETPESIRDKSETFKTFSERVFATHFRKTKARLGGYGNSYDFVSI